MSFITPSDDVRMLKSKDLVALFKEKMNYTASDAQFILDNVLDMLVNDVFMNNMGVDLFAQFKIFPRDIEPRNVNGFDGTIERSKYRKRLCLVCSPSFEKRLTEMGKEMRGMSE